MGEGEQSYKANPAKTVKTGRKPGGGNRWMLAGGAGRPNNMYSKANKGAEAARCVCVCVYMARLVGWKSQEAVINTYTHHRTQAVREKRSMLCCFALLCAPALRIPVTRVLLPRYLCTSPASLGVSGTSGWEHGPATGIGIGRGRRQLLPWAPGQLEPSPSRVTGVTSLAAWSTD
ncbi:hypothetical protein CH063_05387 [Colletotrichum higginsianum]|uniref:Uncharacterized protein n=1 Tax=Colletotrichum higginsianum (strain IMI 349063) TaxID=759273 RepID=H1UYT4_COLHI|nr:hypothetical protein CH063_05387 [Colletotrichum higginsianum]